MKKPIISLIVAAAENDVIGLEGKMPWHISHDLRNFKKVTMGKPIIMGRKTFQSIGRPLPGRLNIVISRNQDFTAEGVTIASSLDEAVTIAGDVEEVMVIGGGQIYAAAFPIADRIYLTIIHASPEGDAHFKIPNPDQWREISSKSIEPAENDTAAATFKELERV